MPKPTFHNLPPAKRRLLVQLAIDEFGQRSYREASLSRIVARVGIAKGSIYQYFDNKLDLYRWLLVEELPRRKLAHLDANPRTRTADTFSERLREMVLSGLEFVRDDPRLALLGLQASRPTTDPELAPLFEELRARSHLAFRTMLEAEREAGELRADLDLDVVARIIAAVLGYGLHDLLVGHFGLGIHTLLEGRDRGPTREQLIPVVDATVRALMEGLGAAPT